MQGTATNALLVFALVAGCQPGAACDDHAECSKGAACRCDQHGRLLQEERDTNGDEVKDRVRYVRDAEGRVTAVDTDWSRNGAIDRHQEFTYDAEGRRMSTAGWQAGCGGRKLHFACSYEPPCSPPYEDCTRCKREVLSTEHADGRIVPCGQPPRK